MENTDSPGISKGGGWWTVLACFSWVRRIIQKIQGKYKILGPTHPAEPVVLCLKRGVERINNKLPSFMD